MMMRSTMLAGLGMLTLGGCQTMTAASNEPRPIEAEEIRYETTRCYGTCPVYAVTVGPDGTGTFVGEQFTAVTGRRDFRLEPGAYQAFAARLAPFRPASGERLVTPGEPGCEQAATDMPSIDVRWTGLEGGSQHLSYDLGCRSEQSEAMAAALRAAPELLPIQSFIGQR